VTRLRLLTALIVLAPAVAAAQPLPPVEPPVPDPQPQPAPVDEGKIREIVDREVARIMAEREAKLAAERKAADERAAGERPATDLDGDYLSGSSGFVDTRLSFTLTNENTFVEPGETNPSIPGWRFGRPNSLGTLFFDNYDTRFSGYETLSHGVLYKNYRKGHLEAEGGLVLRLNALTPTNISLSDAGSYLLVSYWNDPEHTDPTRYSVTVFPVSSDRMRLGYSYRLSWGGDDEWKTSNARPGLKLQYDFKGGYAYVGAKSVVTLDRRTAEQVAQFSVLGGAGYDVTPMVRVEANGGFFDKGSNELADVDDQAVQMFGGSVQVAAHKGMPVQSSIDYKLYKNDPERIGRVFSKQKYPGGLSWLAMAEASLVGQALKDPHMTGTTRVQWGKAGDINVRVLLDRYRLRFDASYRDLAYVVHTVPSIPSFEDFRDDYEVSANYFASVGIDRNWDDKLTLGVVAGVDMPATLRTPNGEGIPGVPNSGQSTAVVRLNPGAGSSLLIAILPEGEKAVPSFAGKVTAQYDFGEIFAAIAEAYYMYDPNSTRYRRSGPEDEFMFVFGEFNQLGVNLTLQAKF
jgi:hypothetical protein